MTGAPRVIVVGAGLGGLTAALGLRRAGFDPIVLERATRLPEPADAVTLRPGALRALRELGLGEALESLGVRPATTTVHSSRGRLLAEIDPGEAPLVIHRVILQGVLRSALDPDPVRLGAHVRDVAETGPGVSASLESDGQVSAELLVAADGVDSIVRTRVFRTPPPTYSGLTAWRGLALLPPRLAEAIGPSRIHGSGALFGLTPVRGGHVSWWATARSPRRAVEDAKRELQERFAGWQPLVRHLINLTPAATIERTELLVAEAPRALAHGRIALIGASAHPTRGRVPCGASDAIEDAAALVAALSDERRVEVAHALYDRRRRPQTRLAARRNACATRLAHVRNPLAVGLRDAAVRARPTIAIPRAA